MTHHTKPKLAAYFKNKEGGPNYPDTFPYRDKAIIMFQKCDGLDICFFGMYIQVLCVLRGVVQQYFHQLCIQS